MHLGQCTWMSTYLLEMLCFLSVTWLLKALNQYLEGYGFESPLGLNGFCLCCMFATTKPLQPCLSLASFSALCVTVA